MVLVLGFIFCADHTFVVNRDRTTFCAVKLIFIAAIFIKNSNNGILDMIYCV